MPKERGLREANAVIAGVRSPPLRGGTSPAWMAVRGKVGDDAEGVFSEILCWVVKPPWFRESGLPGNETLG